jgi:hypothetical protein
MTTEAPTERKFDITPANREILRKHAVNLRDGRLIPSGSYDSTLENVQDLFRKELPAAYKVATAAKRPLQLLFFAHGGTVTEEDAIAQALAHIPIWQAVNVYPIFFVWETSVWLAIRDRLAGRPADRGIADIFGKIKEGAVNATDWAVEKTVRSAGIDDVWDQMKIFAEHGVEPNRGGAWTVAAELANFLKSDGVSAANVQVHCLGHSAGAVFHAWFIPALLAAGLASVDNLFLLAPAITVDLFSQRLLGLIGKKDGITKLTTFTMDEKTELADNVVSVYRKSLLYLISRALEPRVPTKILGLEESIRSEQSLVSLFNYPQGNGAAADLIFSPTGKGKPGSSANSTSHGGFGNEPDTLNSVLFRILGKGAPTPFPPDFKNVVKDSSADRAMPTAPAILPSRPRRLALCIGIDDYPAAPLDGCVNDARLWQETFEALGFESAGLLTNEQATYAGIIDSLEKFIGAAAAGDALVVQFAGHGTQVEDLDGDEKLEDPTDDLDEALVPYDYATGRFVIDDDLARIFDRLPKGAGLTCFMDCCHSGTITRMMGRPPVPAEIGSKKRYLPVPKNSPLAALHREFRASQPAPRGPVGYEGMREVTFSACRADQTAKEKDGHGFFTLAATGQLRTANALSNAAFLKLVAANFPLPPDSQVPFLHCQDGYLELPLFQIGETAPGAVPAIQRPIASPTEVSDARLLMATMNRYLIILDRLTGGKG